MLGAAWITQWAAASNMPPLRPPKVMLLSSFLSNGPIQDTHRDGSFHFFGAIQQQVDRLVTSIKLANATKHAELHIIHDNPTFVHATVHGGARFHRLNGSYQLPPIDARYSAYWELLQQLDPPAETCVFIIDLADVELLRDPWSLCRREPEALFIESGQCDGSKAAGSRLPNASAAVSFRGTAGYLRSVQQRNNYTGTPRLAAYLAEGLDGHMFMYNAGIQGGTWRVFESYLSEMIARVSVHWLRQSSREHDQNFIDMLVVNEVTSERLRKRQQVVTGYPVGPLNMPNRGILCGADALAPNVSGRLARMAATDYYFAHKRKWLPNKRPVYAWPSR